MSSQDSTRNVLTACGQDWTLHPACSLFPPLDPAGIASLAEDIGRNGLLRPIVLHEGAVLDGRNRLLACDRAGVVPRSVRWDGSGSPWSWSWAENAERRHLQGGQKAALMLEMLEGDEAWQAAEKARKEAQGARTDLCATLPKSDPVPHAKDALAEASGTSPRTAQDVMTVRKEDPEAFERVKRGEVSANKAAAAVRKRKAEAKAAEVRDRRVAEPDGLYDVIVIDPPWPMEKIPRDVRPNQAGFDYPTMDEATLAALAVPAADACHAWLWTTHRFLPMAFRLLGAWDLKYVCTFVWHKPGGFQPVGLPQYNCEFALYARRGAPTFTTTKALPVCFDAPRGRHSEKPGAFYDAVRRVTDGRRLDMFNRREIEGFDGWGNETPGAKP